MSGPVHGVIRLAAGGRAVNAYLVGGTCPVLVDAGIPGRGPAILAELEQLGLVPEYIDFSGHGPPCRDVSALLRALVKSWPQPPASPP